MRWAQHFCSLGVAPVGERPFGEAGIVKPAVAGDLAACERRQVDLLCGRGQLHLGHGQPVVAAVELVDLKRMAAPLYNPTRLVDGARLAEVEEGVGLVGRDFPLKLIAAQAAIGRRALYGEVTTAAAQAHRIRVAHIDVDNRVRRAARAVAVALYAQDGELQLRLPEPAVPEAELAPDLNGRAVVVLVEIALDAAVGALRKVEIAAVAVVLENTRDVELVRLLVNSVKCTAKLILYTQGVKVRQDIIVLGT